MLDIRARIAFGRNPRDGEEQRSPAGVSRVLRPIDRWPGDRGVADCGVVVANVVAALPKNNYGKVLKTELRRMAGDVAQ